MSSDVYRINILHAFRDNTTREKSKFLSAFEMMICLKKEHTIETVRESESATSNSLKYPNKRSIDTWVKIRYIGGMCVAKFK